MYVALLESFSKIENLDQQDKIMSETNMKTNRIYYVLQMNIKCDSDEARRWIKDRSVKYTQDLQEEKTLSFEWFISQDGKEATLIELLADSDGYMQRLKNHIESPIAAEVMELVDFKGWLVFGNSKPDLVEALAPFGATFQNYLFGFNHSIETP